MRALLVEDDQTTARSIELILKSENIVVDVTELGEDGLEVGRLYDYDIILLDLMLPDMDGYEVLRRLREAKVETPILILSGLAELDHKIKGLGFGADDYLTKPFDRRELVARIQAIVRRSKGHASSVVTIGSLAVDLAERTVTVDGTPPTLVTQSTANNAPQDAAISLIADRSAMRNTGFDGDSVRMIFGLRSSHRACSASRSV